MLITKFVHGVMIMLEPEFCHVNLLLVTRHDSHDLCTWLSILLLNSVLVLEKIERNRLYREVIAVPLPPHSLLVTGHYARFHVDIEFLV